MLAEVPVADRSCLGRRPAVHPRADDEPRRARLRSRCAGAQAGVVPRRADRPVAFVVPSAEIEDRHPHLVVTRFDIREVPVRAVVRMVEPFEVERHGTSEHRLVAQRNPQQRFAAVRLPPLARVFHGLGACSHTAAASVVWRDVDGNPRQPRQIERAAEIEELARRGEAHRRKRADEMRRRFDRQPATARRRDTRARPSQFFLWTTAVVRATRSCRNRRDLRACRGRTRRPTHTARARPGRPRHNRARLPSQPVARRDSPACRTACGSRAPAGGPPPAADEDRPPAGRRRVRESSDPT